MKILHVLSQFEVTGAEAYAVTLANEQVRQKDSVWMVSDTLTLPRTAQYISYPIGNRGLLQRYKNILFLRQLIRENDIDVVHAHSRAASWVSYFAVHGLKPALVSTIHGRQVVKKKNKFLNVYGKNLITVCGILKKHLVEHCHLPSSAIDVIENPIAFDAIPSLDDRAARADIQNNDCFLLTLAGRTTGPKGERSVQMINSVFAPLLKEFPSLEIQIIGGDPKHLPTGAIERIENLSDLNQRRLHLKGFTQKLPEELARSKAVIASGRIAIEALAMGIPTFAVGEATGHGLVTPDNMTDCRATNFGDVALDTRFGEVNYEQLRSEIQKLIANEVHRGKVSLPNEQKELAVQVRSVYSLSSIEPRVRELYRRSIFSKKNKGWIPVLMYHRVPNEPIDTAHRTFITRDQLAKHFEFFKKKGFTPITFREYEEATSRGTGLPEKPIILTFDDAYEDNYKNLLPLLRHYGFKAVVYVLGDRSIKSNVWDQESGEPVCPLMSPQQIQEMKATGLVEFGSHSMSHAKLPELRDGELEYEVSASKKILEDFLGHPVLSFAYPYGAVDERAKKAVKKAGYRFGIATDSGGRRLEEDRLQIFRVNIFPEDGVLQLMKKTSGRYRDYYAFKRKR